MFARYFIITAIAMLAGCGSSSSPSAPTSTPTPPGPVTPAPPAGPPTVAISTTGFSPLEITVAVGARVTFENNDRVAHDILGGLDHNSRDCPEVEAVGFLLAGQSGQTAPFTQAKTCRFHDHVNVGNAAYQGRIVVQ